MRVVSMGVLGVERYQWGIRGGEMLVVSGVGGFYWYQWMEGYRMGGGMRDITGEVYYKE